MGLKWDDLLMEEREDVQKVSTRMDDLLIAYHVVAPDGLTMKVPLYRLSLVYLSENSTTELSESGLPFNNLSFTRVYPRNNGLLLNRSVQAGFSCRFTSR
jgi:hypothetical protein